MSQNRPGRASDVKDGLSNSIMFAESAGRPTLYRGGRQTGDDSTNRVSGGAWAKPESDFYIDGASLQILADGRRRVNFPPDAQSPRVPQSGLGVINVCNGEDISSLGTMGVYPTSAVSRSTILRINSTRLVAVPRIRKWRSLVRRRLKGFMVRGDLLVPLPRLQHRICRWRSSIFIGDRGCHKFCTIGYSRERRDYRKIGIRIRFSSCKEKREDLLSLFCLI